MKEYPGQHIVVKIENPQAGGISPDIAPDNLLLCHKGITTGDSIVIAPSMDQEKLLQTHELVLCCHRMQLTNGEEGVGELCYIILQNGMFMLERKCGVRPNSIRTRSLTHKSCTAV
jgi:hypothetical protein